MLICSVSVRPYTNSAYSFVCPSLYQFHKYSSNQCPMFHAKNPRVRFGLSGSHDEDGHHLWQKTTSKMFVPRAYKPIYNHATSNLAINSHETSQDKLPKARNRQSIIVIQVHDKLHEKLLVSTCSFL